MEPVVYNLPWLAGFFDGEGSVGIYARNWDRDKKFQYFVLVVSLAQSGEIGRKVLESCAKQYGGTVYKQKTDKAQTLNKVMWKWNVSAEKAKIFLEAIHEFSVIKHTQIMYALNFQSLSSKRSDYQPAAKLAEIVKNLKQ